MCILLNQHYGKKINPIFKICHTNRYIDKLYRLGRQVTNIDRSAIGRSIRSNFQGAVILLEYSNW